MSDSNGTEVESKSTNLPVQNALDFLSAVVTRIAPVASHLHQLEHRVSCHRCASCPHIFCGRCSDKMKEEYGQNVFVGGCPVCHGLCCCSNKTVFCARKNHCYRKCPATKCGSKTVTRRKGDFQYPSNSMQALDFLAAVADGAMAASPVAAGKPATLGKPISEVVTILKLDE